MYERAKRRSLATIDFAFSGFCQSGSISREFLEDMLGEQLPWLAITIDMPPRDSPKLAR